MREHTSQTPASPPRSTKLDYMPSQAFADMEEELHYYKQEYQRLKAIIALQKKKIRKLLG